MKHAASHLLPLLAAGLLLGGCGRGTTAATTTAPPPATAVATPTPALAPGFSIPVEYYTLPNGLRVVLSPDHTAPTATVAVYYNVGFRNEPRDRTGYAHLFEHLMF